ncbi:Clr5 domain-containing protein [Apiospora saccharicola]|uniref:Clr5 domain-containing protein n=1 Tax=Apiospora saccharicola TaxID=335842 RepID=A0ABR1WNK4_9PEZI
MNGEYAGHQQLTPVATPGSATTPPMEFTVVRRPSRIAYASSDEWERHHDTIVDLYIKRRLGLPDVCRIMREQHNFVATERMYKMRFRIWSDAKTDPNKWREAHETRISGPSAGSGKQLNRPPSPGWSTGLFPIATPELVKAPEESLFLARKYVRGLFSVGLWKKDQDVTLYEEKWNGIIGCKFDCPLWPPLKRNLGSYPVIVNISAMCSWLMQLFSGYGQFNLGGDMIVQQGKTKEAFRVISRCFEQLSSLMEPPAPDPRLIVPLLSAAVYNSANLPELVIMFIKHMVELLRLKGAASPYYPLYLILNRMSRMSIAEFQRNLSPFFDFYFDELESHFDPASAFTGAIVYVRGAPVLNQALKGLVQVSVAESYYLRLLARLEAMPQVGGDQVLKANLQLLNIYEDMRETQKFTRHAQRILASEQLKQHPQFRAYVFLSMLGHAREQLDHEEILKLAPLVMDMCVSKQRSAAGGRDRPLEQSLEIRAISMVEQFLRELALVEQADAFRREFDATMDELYQEKVEDDDVGGRAGTPVDAGELHEAVHGSG